MARTHIGIITAALVLSAVLAAGCQERGKTAEKKTQEAKSNAEQIVPTTLVGDEGPVAPPAPVNTGPVSFVDGETAYHAGNYAEATTIFARYTGQQPENAWGHFMLGLSSWKGGDLARAEQAFDAALEINPNHVKSLVNSSRVMLEQKRPDDAVVRLMRASEIDPTSNAVYRLLGRAYGAQGRIDEAVVAYQHAIELDENDSWAMNNLGLLFIEQGLAADAVPLLTKAVELGKDVPTFRNNLGMALEHTGQFSAAATAYGGALTADPDHAKAKQNLARVEKVKEDPKVTSNPDTAEKPVVGSAGIESDQSNVAASVAR